EEEEVERFKEVGEFLDKFFKSLFLIIAFMATAVGEDFSKKHSIVMKLMVLLVLLYFLLCLLGTMLRNKIEWFSKMLFWMILLIACFFNSGFDHCIFIRCSLGFCLVGWNSWCQWLLQCFRASSIICFSHHIYIQEIG
ncbi:hypothetical protein HN51_043960, partial [Arachis hypogaea]